MEHSAQAVEEIRRQVFPPVCPECHELDVFTIVAAIEHPPHSGDVFTCCSCAAIGTHTGLGLEVRRATPSEVAAAIDDPLVVATLALIHRGHELGAL